MPDVFCKACGTIDEATSSRVAELEETVKQLGIEVGKKNGQIKRLRKDQANERPPEYDDAMAVALYWRELLMPGARELNGPRMLATIARLQHGYDVPILKRSVWGYYCRPHMKNFKRVRVSQGGTWKADLSYICHNATRVDEGLRIAEEELGHDQDLINHGGSRFVAQLCNCGHSRADHALYRHHGHDGCLRVDATCACEAFDDTDELMRLHDQRSERTRHQTPPTQMSL